MNNHQNAIFHQITNFLKTPLALLGVDLKNFQFNKICHFANHPYLCKGLLVKLNNNNYVSDDVYRYDVQISLRGQRRICTNFHNQVGNYRVYK